MSDIYIIRTVWVYVMKKGFYGYFCEKCARKVTLYFQVDEFAKLYNLSCIYQYKKYSVYIEYIAPQIQKSRI
jgi:hypothetical protein